MENYLVGLFTVIVIVGLTLTIIPHVSDDGNSITGDFKIKKPNIIKQIQKEASRAEHRIIAEAQREANDATNEAQRFTNRAGKEAGRFGKRADAEWQRTDERVSGELNRFGGRVDAEFNRIDDNIKKLGDKAEAEYKRLLRKVKDEINAQTGTIKNLAQGKVCKGYQEALQSEVLRNKIEDTISRQIIAPIKNLLRPHVASIVATMALPINSIPVLGQAIYAAVVPAATEWGTDYAAQRAINEALKQCD